MFYLLSSIDYNQTWEQIEYGLGYDLGDYRFADESSYQKVRDTAKAIWTQLQGHFDDNGMTPSVYTIREGKSVRKIGRTPSNRIGVVLRASDQGFNHWEVQWQDNNEVERVYNNDLEVAI